MLMFKRGMRWDGSSLTWKEECRHEKSGVWFLQHIFHFSEGSSKLAGIFQKMQAGNVVFTTRTKAYFDNLCSGLMDSLNQEIQKN